MLSQLINPRAIETFLLARWVVFVMIYARIAGVLLPIPIFSRPYLPRRVRFALALVLTFLIFPLVPEAAVPEAVSSKPGCVLVLNTAIEFLIGLAAGVGIALFFSALTLLGELASRLGGWSVAAAFNSPVEERPVLITFVTLLGIVVFFLSGGMPRLVIGLLESFRVTTLGNPLTLENLTLVKVVDLLNAAVTSALGLALRMAFPLILTSFTVWLAAGLLARSIPNLGMMPIGFSANTLLSLALMNLTIAVVFALFGQKITQAFEILRSFGGGS